MAGRKEWKRNDGWGRVKGTKARMKIKWAKIKIKILEYEKGRDEIEKEKKYCPFTRQKIKAI